jgi:hypothetical protein
MRDLEVNIQSNVSFLGEFDFSELFSLGHLVLVLDSHDTTSPLSVELLVLVELGSELSGESFQVLDVFLSDISESDAGGGLGVNELSKSSLTLDEAIWNSLGLAQSWEENNHLNWVNVVSNNDQLGLLLLNKRGHVVKSELKVNWLWANMSLGVSSLSLLSLRLKSLFFFLSGLWAIFREQFKKLTSLVLVDGIRKLVDCWWALKTLEKDSLLTLNTNVLWPLDEPSKVSSWLNISTDSEVSGTLLEQRILI